MQGRRLHDGSLPLPDLPMVTFGWGSLPDQYGRVGGGVDPYSATDEDPYPEGLEDVATLLARATTGHGSYRPDKDAVAMLRSWIRLGRPPRTSEVDIS